MPLYDFNCPKCNKTFEMLIKASSVPLCPECGSSMEKQVSCPTAPGQSAGIIARSRAKAAREGHFSNYNASERPKSK